MSSVNGESLLRKVITISTAAELAVLSPRQIQRLIKDGIISLARDKRGNQLRGRVVIGEALPRLFEYAREHAAGDPSVARFRAARAEKEEAEAAMAQIELGYRRQKYLLASAVEEDAIRMLTACRARFLAIPSSIARSLIGKTDFKEIYLILETSIHTALREISKLGEAGREYKKNAYETTTTDNQ